MTRVCKIPVVYSLGVAHPTGNPDQSLSFHAQAMGGLQLRRLCCEHGTPYWHP